MNIPRSSEQGVFVPLAAVVLAGAITLLFATGVDSLLVRLTRSELQRTTNQICLSLSGEVFAPDLAAPAFRDSVMTLKDSLSFATLDSATLVLPAQKESLLGPISPSNACTGTLPSVDEVGASPALGVPAWTSFGSISDSFPTCSLDAENPADRDCKLWSYPNHTLPPGFPESAKSALLPGRSIGCIMSARVKRYAGGPPVKIWGRALYSARSRNPGNSSDGSDPSALRIAIGTEMATPDFKRLSIPSPGVELIFDRSSPLTFAAVENAGPGWGQRDFYDPIFWDHDPFCAPPNPPNPNDPWCPRYRDGNRSDFLLNSSPGDFLSAFSAPRPITPRIPITAPGYPLPNENDPGFLRGGWQLSDSQIKEMLVACSNPPVLIRNILAQTFIELAARDPALRNRTEVLHINPRNVGASPKLNPPTQMVPLGVDITTRAFQIPFVPYAQEDVVIEGKMMVGLGGADSEIAPFSGTSSLDDDEERIHATLTTQLRVCYHLYTGRFNGDSSQRETKGLSRNYLARLFDSPYGLLSSGAGPAFEFNRRPYPPEIRPPAFNPPRLYPGLGSEPVAYGYETLEPPTSPRLPSDIYKAPPNNAEPRHFYPQEQESPWVRPFAGAFTNLLSAGELVSILGSSQRCPYSDLSDPGKSRLTRRSDGRFMNRCPSSPPGDDGLASPALPGVYPSKDGFYASPIGDSPDTVGELLPDVSGLFSYLQFSTNPLNPVNPNPTVLLAPGLAHPSDPPVEKQIVTPCANSSLIIILHSLVTPSEVSPSNWDFEDHDYLKGIKNQISSFRNANPKSPILVIYIPATPFQAQPRITEEILPALVGLPTQPPDPFITISQDPNLSLVVLAPLCGTVQGGPVGTPPVRVCKESTLHNYWNLLLNPASNSYIVPMARRLFLERLYHVERVL